MYKNVIFSIMICVGLSSCVTVRPGEVGMVQTLGRLSDKVKTQGPVFYNPFTQRVVKTSIQTSNLELSLNLPSKEGLSVNSQISILYRVEKNKVPNIIRELSLDYEPVISNVFRSASADVCSQFFAKDMHSGMRANIEEAIRLKMDAILGQQGILIESVLMKSIQLPAGLANSIEQKLQAEQDAMRMEFILQQARLEAERKTIEAKGARDAQIIMSEGLTDQILRLKGIEALNNLAKSPNGKIIITNGSSPLILE
ncbi:MAG: prohibitin family protein [Saprospiraceae bacterium]|nr:prohibitin family protein [Saprospiraceae bacterium]MBK6565292.1 prohibitin family protein [Saprospiraceae bacterium]MBK8080141.1 prohibitin family protein [Saprospiraceae bacterium]MBK8371111.1 prohibitin family protein [Saprospiraceae bacterium]MBK8546042.1 prohibitin family protein [Saprospiraceae bacterium]